MIICGRAYFWVQMIHNKNVRELSSLIFLYTDIFPNFNLYFTDFSSFSATEVAIGRKIWNYLYWNLREKLILVTRLSNDESAHPSTLLKLESTIDVFIDQVRKFQNSYFKQYLLKAATVLRKACILRTCYEICSW